MGFLMHFIRSLRNDTVAKVAPSFWEYFSNTDIQRWTTDAHERTLDLLLDLSEEQFIGPQGETVNPLLWELGHVAWFYERWLLRESLSHPSLLPQADAIYDSTGVAHAIRWNLPLPTPQGTIDYLEAVHQQVVEQLNSPVTDERAFLHLMSLFHQDMHTEAFVINRQTWAFPRPQFRNSKENVLPQTTDGPCPGDVDIPGGEFLLGGSWDDPFVFDNEKWQHPIEFQPFSIAKAPVTQGEFLEFVNDNGYDRQELWSEQGWKQRLRWNQSHPGYWQKRDNVWYRRDFTTWVPLEPFRPVINLGWYEAEAYCKWANRRLPTEAEWEAAACLSQGRLDKKRRFPWGDDWPTVDQANLDGHQYGCVDVAAFEAGDSSAGCRQMIGNVWEWTSTNFDPYPGFVSDPYEAYSQPWFGGNFKVLRGGCWLTRSRLIRNTFRTFYLPQRRDVWAGFRTCAL